MSQETPSSAGRMPLIPALEVIRDLRRDQVVVSTMGTAREWPKLSTHPLDFHYIPSAMGHAPTLALGMAIAQPQREVIAFNGDGCMLMSLGCLVTIIASGAKNLTLLVINNGLYEVTGGQRTAAVRAGADFTAVARAAGFETARTFSVLADWRREARGVLAAPGPRFVTLMVEPVGEDYLLESPGPIGPRVAAFRQALAR